MVTLHYTRTTTTLNYITLRYTNYITPRYATLITPHSTPLHKLQLQLQHNTTQHYTKYIILTTPHHTALTTSTPTTTTALLYTTSHSTSLHYTTLHYIPLHSLHHHKCICNYTAQITLHHNYNTTTLQLQLQLRYTMLHPAVVGEVTDKVTTATIAAASKNTTPTTFRSIRVFALPFVIHNNQALL